MSRKDWLKIRTGKLWENQSLSNLAFAVFSFQIALKLKCIIFFEVTKIAFFPKKKHKNYLTGVWGLCPRPRTRDMEAEVENFCGSGKKVPLTLRPFLSNVKTLRYCNCLKKYTTKSKCLQSLWFDRSSFAKKHFQNLRFT